MGETNTGRGRLVAEEAHKEGEELRQELGNLFCVTSSDAIAYLDKVWLKKAMEGAFLPFDKKSSKLRVTASISDQLSKEKNLSQK